MQKKMITITIILLVAFAIALPIFLVWQNDATETIAITIGTTFYHFAIRLAIGHSVNAIMKNRANPRSWWFKEKQGEKAFYRFIKIRKWKKYLPTYNPSSFDTAHKTIDEIIQASCQAEIVHEIIVVFSFVPIAFAHVLGSPAAFIITSILAAAFDSLFIVLQRYNRPKLLKAHKRFTKLQNRSQDDLQ